MSGICGVFRRNGGPVGPESVTRMLEKIRHRGPDTEAVWTKDSVGFGQCMLWVTPESLYEKLPNYNAESKLGIVADARIDNRSELIEALRVTERTKEITDSELILAAYQQWGENCSTHLTGDFAFAIWDGRNQKLFCASDHMGVKSLYYYLTDQAVVFASEIKAILAMPEVPCRLNEMRVADYLVTLFEDRAGTFYEGIQRLPGAHTLSVGRDKSAVRKYWKLDSTKEIRLGSDAEYVEAFRELFTESVRCRTRSAYPIGATVSGGLDSSSIACLARNLTSGNSSRGLVHTFSLIFPGLPDEDKKKIDERSEIHAVLNTGGFEPHLIEADRLSPMGQIERMHFHMDAANCAPNLYLHWAMYGTAQANGVRVFLDGFDGDSTVSHGFERLADLAKTLRWKTLRSEVAMLSENHLKGIRARRIIREYCIRPLTPRWAFLVWHLLHGRKREVLSQNIVIGKDLKERTGIVERAAKMLRDDYAWSPTRSAREYHRQSIDQALYAYTLDIADKATAAFSVEARYPFFDKRLIEFCLALPAEQKLGQGWNRWILRRAMSGILPKEIQYRPKKGDLSPNFHRRLLDFEKPRLEQVALGGDSSIKPFVDADALKSLYRVYEKSYVRSQSESIQLFGTVNLALWLRASGLSS